MDQWFDIKEKVPEEGQEVYYYFKPLGKFRGFYHRCTGEDALHGTHTFYGKSGWLTDDVTHWFPVLPGVPVPPLPVINDGSWEVIDDDEGWEVCDLWHDVDKKGVGKHPTRLSIHTENKYRQTYCIDCGKSVMFERIPKDINIKRIENAGI